jgi:hydrogenase expression/formation protein HypD
MLLNKPKRKIKLMEICGTHTMAIAQNGIRSLLEENIELVSGPGCPVCVTPSNIIDICLELLKEPNIVIFSYGDMLRVPGSKGKRLFQHKQVKMCLSPLEALDYAKENPNKQIIFLGVGFETTTPGSAICILEAYKQNIKNFFFYSLLKRTEPALRTLLKDNPDIDGFICPGHVACILGEQGFQFLSKEYHKPGVISGFEAEDILCSI